MTCECIRRCRQLHMITDPNKHTNFDPHTRRHLHANVINFKQTLQFLKAGGGDVGILVFCGFGQFSGWFFKFCVIFDIVIHCGFSVFIGFLFGFLILINPKAPLYTDSKLAKSYQNMINEANYFIIHFYCEFSPLNSVHGSHDLI